VPPGIYRGEVLFTRAARIARNFGGQVVKYIARTCRLRATRAIRHCNTSTARLCCTPRLALSTDIFVRYVVIPPHFPLPVIATTVQALVLERGGGDDDLFVDISKIRFAGDFFLFTGNRLQFRQSYRIVTLLRPCLWQSYHFLCISFVSVSLSSRKKNNITPDNGCLLSRVTVKYIECLNAKNKYSLSW